MSFSLKVPFLGRFFKRLDRVIAKEGLQRGMYRLVTASCNKFQVTTEAIETETILREKPGVVVTGTHVSEFDPAFLLAAMPKRDDVYLIMDARYMGVSKSFDKYIIPAYTQNNVKTRYGAIIKAFLFKLIHSTEKYSEEEEHRRNVASIKRASEVIDNGGLVIMFTGNKDVWFDGVGHLIEGVKNKKRSFLVKTYIAGPSEFDSLRLLPGIGLTLPKVEVAFSAPRTLDTIYGIKGKGLSRSVRDDYRTWLKEKDQQHVIFKQKSHWLKHTFKHAKRFFRIGFLPD